MGPKLTLSLRILASLGNGGLSHKGYKMWCLQMPLFWFVNCANGIKRIRDKKICFDIRLGLNPRIWLISCIHRAGCNPKELGGICMFELPPLLLEKWAMTGLLSHNLFFQLQAKDNWLNILKSLKKKKKNKQGQRSQPSTKQTRVLLWA